MERFHETSSWRVCHDPITGRKFYHNDKTGKSSWNYPSKNRRLSERGTELFRQSQKRDVDGVHGGIALSYDMTRRRSTEERVGDLDNFVPQRIGGLSVAPQQLKCGLKDPLKFTDVEREIRPGVRKPKQVFCYSCGREFGTSSLKIHWKSCVRKREIEMKRRPPKLRKPCAQPPDESKFPFPCTGSSDGTFREYNREALRIYGNFHGIYICWSCKRQFSDQNAFENHVCARRPREDNEINSRAAEERKRKEKLEAERRRRLEDERRRQEMERLEAERRRRLEDERRQQEMERRQRFRPVRVFVTNEQGIRIGEATLSPSTTVSGIKRLCKIPSHRKLSIRGRSVGDDESITAFDLQLRDGDEIHVCPIVLRAKLIGMSDAVVVAVAGEDSFLAVKVATLNAVREYGHVDVSNYRASSMRLVLVRTSINSSEEETFSDRDTVNSLLIRDGDMLLERSLPPPPAPARSKIEFMSPDRRRRMEAQRAKNLMLHHGAGHRAADQALVGLEKRERQKLFTTRRLRRSSIREANSRMKHRVAQGDEFHHRQWGCP